MHGQSQVYHMASFPIYRKPGLPKGWVLTVQHRKKMLWPGLEELCTRACGILHDPLFTALSVACPVEYHGISTGCTFADSEVALFLRGGPLGMKIVKRCEEWPIVTAWSIPWLVRSFCLRPTGWEWQCLASRLTSLRVETWDCQCFSRLDPQIPGSYENGWDWPPWVQMLRKPESCQTVEASYSGQIQSNKES